MRNANRAKISWWEVAVAVLLVAWRLAAQSPARYWRDWMIVFGVVWLYTALKPRSPASPLVLVTAMAYLLGIYLLGQLPHALAVLWMGS